MTVVASVMTILKVQTAKRPLRATRGEMERVANTMERHRVHLLLTTANARAPLVIKVTTARIQRHAQQDLMERCARTMDLQQEQRVTAVASAKLDLPETTARL